MTVQHYLQSQSTSERDGIISALIVSQDLIAHRAGEFAECSRERCAALDRIRIGVLLRTARRVCRLLYAAGALQILTRPAGHKLFGWLKRGRMPP